MTHASCFRLARRAARALPIAFFLAALPAAAAAQDNRPQDIRPPAGPPLEAFRPEIQEAIGHILVRLREHQFRLVRIDNLSTYFRSVNNLEKVRLVGELRERELDSFKKLMDEYRRLLGTEDFDRLMGVLRKRLATDGIPPAPPPADLAEVPKPRPPAREVVDPGARASASERAARVNARVAEVTARQRARNAAQTQRFQPATPTDTSGARGGQASPAQRDAAPATPTRRRP